MAATFCELKQKEYLAETAGNKTVENKRTVILNGRRKKEVLVCFPFILREKF